MLALFVQFVARFRDLPAIIAVVLNSLVQPVVGTSNPPLTIIVGVQLGNSGHYRKGGRCHRCKRPFSEEKLYPSISHISFILLG